MGESDKDSGCGWAGGRVQVYTGDGKGKTTAALGLAFRAMGRGLRTYIGQFMKGMAYGELDAAVRVEPWIVIEQYGSDRFICLGEKDPEECARAARGLERIRAVLESGEYRIVVMDEVCTALHFGLVELDDVLAAIRSRPEGVELVLTGRNAPEAVLEAADLVTEMRSVKHYYDSGFEARRGIEN